MLKAEIGKTLAGVERRILSHQEAGKRGGRGRKAAGNARSFHEDNNTVAHKLARLKRDWPELHARVVAGEMSAHRADRGSGLPPADH